MMDFSPDHYVNHTLDRNSITIHWNPKVFTGNLSKYMQKIEVIGAIDAFQLSIELLVTLLSIFGNVITIIVLWRVAQIQKAQLLRVALAVADLMLGITQCALGLYDHCYYLWCVYAGCNCNYNIQMVSIGVTVGIVRTEIMYYCLCFLSVIAFDGGFLIIVFMVIDRFIAIVNPLDYDFVVTKERVYGFFCILTIVDLFYLWYFIDSTLKGDLVTYYRPASKTTGILILSQAIRDFNFIFHLAFFIILTFALVVLISITLWKLKKANMTRNHLVFGSSNQLQDETGIQMSCTLILILTFSLCTISPQMLWAFLKNSLDETIDFIVKWLILSTSCFNFIIYNLLNGAFRKRCGKILRKLLGLGRKGLVFTCFKKSG
ncbi:unnamed protein product [Meganyctiphanes norvegica]|uniref:G-protein coupled receptors family 1 profile domain-containing protein n=1 Tax=Meganyctiphanes norvegica TaxID=48144 RepID=A0AAV2S5H8_MEGNR